MDGYCTNCTTCNNRKVSHENTKSKYGINKMCNGYCNCSNALIVSPKKAQTKNIPSFTKKSIKTNYAGGSVSSNNCNPKWSSVFSTTSSNTQNRNKTWLQTLHDKDIAKNKTTEASKIRNLNNESNSLKKDLINATDNANESSYRTKKRAGLLVDLFQDKIENFDDRHFLELLADIRTVMNIRDQQHENYTNVGEYAKKLKNSQHRTKLITDDEKKDSIYTKKATLKDQYGNLTETGIMMKGFANLLKDLNAVKTENKDQRVLIENLIAVIEKSREEHKVVSKIKDIQKELETRLSIMETENSYLKSSNEKCKNKCIETKNLLAAKEKELENLTRQMQYWKTNVFKKMDKGIRYFVDETEQHAFNDTIASLPNHQESFNKLIRPASSSPTEEIISKSDAMLTNKPRSPQQHQHESRSPSTSQIFQGFPVNSPDKTPENIDTKNQEDVPNLFWLQNNIEQILTSEPSKTDDTFNLSATTYQLNL